MDLVAIVVMVESNGLVSSTLAGQESTGSPSHMINQKYFQQSSLPSMLLPNIVVPPSASPHRLPYSKEVNKNACPAIGCPVRPGSVKVIEKRFTIPGAVRMMQQNMKI